MKVKYLIEKLGELDSESQILLFNFKEDQFFKITNLPIELGPNKYILGIEKTETAEWS